MKRSCLLILLLCNCSQFSVFSQEEVESTGLKSVVEVEFFLGGGEAFSPLIPEQMWNKYLPDFSEPASTDGYNQSSGTWYGSPSFLFSFRKSYRNRFLETSNIRSSAGIIFGTGAGVYSEQAWSKSTSVTIDSFTVASTGQQFAIDSFSNDYISRNYRAQDFLIGISQRYETNPAKRFSFHYGIDLLFGFSGNSRMSSTHSQYVSYSPTVGQYSTATENFQSDNSTFDGPKYRSVNVQFPLELGLKPFMKKSGWNVLTVGFCVRPALQWYYLDSEKGTLFSPWYGMVLRAAI